MDPSAWQTNVSTFGGVRYREIYPGIDLVFHPREYDFLLAPGADPSRIEIEIRGASSARIDPSGALVVRLPQGTLRRPKPVAFQDGRSVPVRFIRRSAHGFGFSIGKYDRARPLLIDPLLLYSTYLGGSGRETRIAGLGSRSQVKTAVLPWTRAIRASKLAGAAALNAPAAPNLSRWLKPMVNDCLPPIEKAGDGAPVAFGIDAILGLDHWHDISQKVLFVNLGILDLLFAR